MADATQIRQVVMNLITNAAEAIGAGSGTITLRTGEIRARRSHFRHSYPGDPLPAGLYVYLDVADTGSGMDDETIARIFDPFFTTKFTGRGLGLAAVLGIVRGHRGALKVASQPGKGTTFRLLFPASGRAADEADDQVSPDTLEWRSSGTVLVVDDEQSVRELAKDMLERAGFLALLAADGKQAVELFKQNAHQIRAVLLDLTMPDMDGEGTFRKLRDVGTPAPIILSSGFTEQDAASRFGGLGLAGFLHKPYRMGDLLTVLRRALGED
jgi:CheY-like chemotaxis protein